MISLANVEVTLENSELCDLVDARCPVAETAFWHTRAFPGPGLNRVAWPTGHRPAMPIRTNTFHWPVGASRWAFGHWLAASRIVELVANVAYGDDGTQMNKIRLFMDSQDNPNAFPTEFVDTQVWLLPPTPLVRLDPFPVGDGLNVALNALYLLTVVDDRYYWWNKSFSGIEGAYVGSSTQQEWNDYLVKFRSDLGDLAGAWTFPAVPAAYLKPDVSFNKVGEVLPPLIDAAATNIGTRFVRRFDGKCEFQSFADAKKSRDRDVSGNDPGRTLKGGGDRYKYTL